jgi:hypothetical protein
MSETTFEKKCSILADLWLLHKDDEDFEDFIEYNDLGLPLAYALDNDIIVANEKTVGFIDETFGLLLDGLELKDTGFDSLNEVLMLPEEEDTNE